MADTNNKKMEKTYFQPSKSDQMAMQDPNTVVKKLILALESKQPKLHYYVGFTAQALAILRCFLSDGLLDSLLAKRR